MSNVTREVAGIEIRSIPFPREEARTRRKKNTCQKQVSTKRGQTLAALLPPSPSPLLPLPPSAALSLPPLSGPPNPGEEKELIKQEKRDQKTNRYAPLVLIQLGLVEASSLLPRPLLAVVAAGFVAARLLHASAMAYGGAFERRVRGTKGTFLSIAVLSLCCAVAAVKALL